MKRLEARLVTRMIFLFIVGIFLVGSNLLPEHVFAQETQIIAFIHINVIPMDSEGVLEDHTVVVQNGLITEVAPRMKWLYQKGRKSSMVRAST